jgi:hypothetical protein
VAVLAAVLGRGYVGRHRLEQAVLGRPVDVAPPERRLTVHLLPTHRPSAVAAPPAQVRSGPGRASVAPWLRVVPTAHEPDQLADTVPHPVVRLLPLGVPAGPPVSSRSLGSAESAVFALVDAERERAVTADLAAGADVRPYRARHTA